MTSLDLYLSEHFLNACQFAAACGISVDELDDLIRQRLIPAPTYTVTESSGVSSILFGEMQAEGSTPGRYFRPANSVWVDIARDMVTKHGAGAAARDLKSRFGRNLQAALKELNDTTLRQRDCFADDGALISAGIADRIDSYWEHFLDGTFGLCVANPISEAAIARKSVLQQKLNQISDNGSRKDYSESETQSVLDLVDAYAEASMPFSPVEYHLSSRKRLVDEIRACLRTAR